ncbi:head maturation protease, ClpP-related [Ihubacter sp. rT4E-8]|uniref:head maturation protease, ClpP-related n=1 Tax=Ihubacter sp. rT4E-8 TaxID=3242369 RepID=UPI003CE94453
MKTKKFWNWKKAKNQETGAEERILELSGTIAEDSWFDDDVTPQLFKDELNSGTGDITVWINSPGGDCVAAAQIYNMLAGYKGKVTVKIDGIAASAASVIAMAGDTVLVSPVSMLMIHNPATMAWGDHAEMQKAMDMLSEVKESIINAYVLKTGLSRPKLSHLMDAETWMDANKAVELGFADDIMARAKTEPEEGEGNTDGEEKKSPSAHSSMLFSRRAADNALLNKVIAKYGEKKPKAGVGEQARIPAPEGKNEPETETGRSVDALMERLNLLKR